jgi:hypothetical protein
VSQIRDQFNAFGYIEMVANGQLRAVVRSSKEMSMQTCERTGFPPGTRTEIVVYWDDLTRVALVHQIRLPNGELGASGLPDPKELLVDGCMWFV